MNDFSICIPTYNRAGLLRRCLEHLASFEDKKFEILVGDNASSDETEEIVDEMRPRFAHFVYLKHRENVGFARNMDSLLRRATRKFIYILNDDDLVFEQALLLTANIMNANPAVAAVIGQYMSLRQLNPSLRVDYSDAVATLVGRGAHDVLLKNLNFCDGHPIMRRDIFERHCAYLDRTGTLIPLYFTLLFHGDICVIDKPFFQHLTNSNSLTSRMAEAWFLDMANADLELAISGCLRVLPPDAMQEARQKLLHIMYFQAARMSISRKSPYLLWLFLRRLTAILPPDLPMLLKCEYHFTHDFLVNRVASILRDTEARTVHFVASATVEAVLAEVSREVPEVCFVAVDPSVATEDAEYLVCENRGETSVPEGIARILALDDLFGQVRLTWHPACLAVHEARILVQYLAQESIDGLVAPSSAFEAVCAPYSEL